MVIRTSSFYKDRSIIKDPTNRVPRPGEYGVGSRQNLRRVSTVGKYSTPFTQTRHKSSYLERYESSNTSDIP